MRKQRIHSYFPDLNMANFSFYVYQGDLVDEFSSVYLYFFKNKRDESLKFSGFNELKIGINNIGFGVAKNVQWGWNFDFKLAKKVLCRNKSVKWKKNENTLLIDSNTLDIKWTFNMDEEHLGGYYNFILPYSNENRETEITIPSYYINLYWLYMATQINVKEISYFEDDFTPLELNVTYTDIHLNRLKKTFLVYLKFDFIGLPGEKNKELAKLRFVIKEK